MVLMFLKNSEHEPSTIPKFHAVTKPITARSLHRFRPQHARSTNFHSSIVLALREDCKFYPHFYWLCRSSLNTSSTRQTQPPNCPRSTKFEFSNWKIIPASSSAQLEPLLAMKFLFRNFFFFFLCLNLYGKKMQLFCSSSHWPGQANNSLKNYCICAEIVHNSQFKSESHPPATTARGCGNDRHGRCCWCSRCWYRTRKAKTSNIYSIISFDFHAFCTMLMIKGACAIYVAGKCMDADCLFCFGRVNYQEVVNDSKEVVKDCLCLILWYWAEIDSLRQLI